MYALVSPLEKYMDWEDKEVGIRIVEVAEKEFAVAEPYYWIECNNSVNPEWWCVVPSINSNLGEFYRIPDFPHPPPTDK